VLHPPLDRCGLVDYQQSCHPARAVGPFGGAEFGNPENELATVSNPRRALR